MLKGQEREVAGVVIGAPRVVGGSRGELRGRDSMLLPVLCLFADDCR